MDTILERRSGKQGTKRPHGGYLCVRECVCVESSLCSRMYFKRRKGKEGCAVVVIPQGQVSSGAVFCGVRNFKPKAKQTFVAGVDCGRSCVVAHVHCEISVHPFLGTMLP